MATLIEQHPIVPTARWIAIGVGVLVAAVIVLQVTTITALDDWGQQVASLLLTSTAFTLVGGAIAARLQHNAFGWVMLAIGALSAVAAAGVTLPGPWALTWIGYWLWLVPLGLLPIALLLFPTGRLPSPRWRPALALALVGTAEPTLALAVASWVDPDPLGLLDDGPPPQATPLVLLARLGLLAAALALLAALASLFARFRRAAALERRQLLCLGVGGAGLALGFVLDMLDIPVGWILAAVALPAAAGVAILRHRLYDLDVFLDRSLVYAGLTIALLAAYGTVVLLGDQLLQPALGDEVFPLLAAAIVAVAVEPLRRRLQRSVDHVLYGDRGDPYAVVTALGRGREAVTDTAAVLAEMTEIVAGSLAIPYVAIELEGDAGVVRMTEWGRRLAEPEAIPLTYRGQRVGTLHVTPRTVGRSFSRADRRLLEDLAGQVALTAHVIALSDGLQRSREDIVSAREEERRRLRNDLHDGLGPTLAGMTMKLEAARNLLAEQPAVADRLLGEAQDAAHGAVADIRRVVYELRPPALDELGLIGAIRDYTERFQLPPGDPRSVSMVVHAPEAVPPLPAAIEVAALRIVQEAINNVARHANAHACSVRLTVGDGVDIVVADDGDGLPGDVHAGVGLNSMRERAAEVGGSCSVARGDAGGTSVTAHLPLALA
jgi:signal transduction histidine kinase